MLSARMFLCISLSAVYAESIQDMPLGHKWLNLIRLILTSGQFQEGFQGQITPPEMSLG